MRLKARRDLTEQEIMTTLEAAGYGVIQISESGKPDLLVCKDGKAWLVECKSKGGKLRPRQVQFIATWDSCPVIVAKSASEVLERINVGF